MVAAEGGIRRLLVANRGVAAARVIATCDRLGVETVLAASEVDRQGPLARAAGRVVCVGPAPASQSYLRREALVAAALGSGCDAVHPGYGFLSEDPAFAAMCREAGLVFVGPSTEQLHLWGDKVRAREAALRARIPVSGGSDGLAGPAEALAAASSLGYPLMLKAVAGGGGKGMRLVRGPGELEGAFAPASHEAAAAFGDGTLYLEEYLPRARHVEVQVVADHHGEVAHLGDRDCSVQRRHQKLVEEAPAPGLPPGLAGEVREAAVSLCREAGYDGVGTVELLVDPERGRVAFLEVNPRLQVEHGVTELVTGVDVVALQIGLAAGAHLEDLLGEVVIRGAAIECRVNAEDPAEGFRPSPGRLSRFDLPRGPGTRVDTHCEAGCLVPPFYDSLVANLMVVAADRAGAVEAMLSALDAARVEGISTTMGFQRDVLDSADFRGGRIWTGWVDEVMRGRGSLRLEAGVG